MALICNHYLNPNPDHNPNSSHNSFGVINVCVYGNIGWAIKVMHAGEARVPA